MKHDAPHYQKLNEMKAQVEKAHQEKTVAEHPLPSNTNGDAEDRRPPTTDHRQPVKTTTG